eukprot:16447365-Heterocapsa_arctica.AAC.1
MLLRLRIGLSSSYVVQHDQRSARNLMVIARMPRDRSKTFTNLQQPSSSSRSLGRSRSRSRSRSR